jgi:hypothetical protein
LFTADRATLQTRIVLAVRRIENYKELQKKIESTVADALDQAPWTQAQKK